MVGVVDGVIVAVAGSVGKIVRVAVAVAVRPAEAVAVADAVAVGDRPGRPIANVIVAVGVGVLVAAAADDRVATSATALQTIQTIWKSTTTGVAQDRSEEGI